jgi:hypothetical protein
MKSEEKEKMDDLIQTAEMRRQRALGILESLSLFKLWGKFGEPVLVGAVAQGLVQSLDIDMEVYSGNPEIWQGFEVMGQAASRPGVVGVQFVNALDTPDRGLYWALKVVDPDRESWKIDCWHVGHDHPDAHCAERFAKAVSRVLTDDSRRTILTLKRELRSTGSARGIDICRAVIQGGARDAEGYRQWAEANPPEPGMVYWRPDEG